MTSGSSPTSGTVYDLTASRLVESTDRRRILRRAESRESSRTSVSMRCHSRLRLSTEIIRRLARVHGLRPIATAGRRANLPAFQQEKGTPIGLIVQPEHSYRHHVG